MTLVLCAVTGCSTPRSPQPQKLALSAIKGRAFAITVRGDLMPARMASVYLLRYEVLDDEKDPQQLRPRMAYMASACQNLERMRPLHIRAAEDVWRSAYRRELSGIENTFRGMVTSSGGFVAQADEDGRFSFDQIPPNSYGVIAIGQAGVNLGYWFARLTLKPGERAEAKLSAPVLSCSVL
jgi:hypothetical protein